MRNTFIHDVNELRADEQEAYINEELTAAKDEHEVEDICPWAARIERREGGWRVSESVDD